MRIVTRWPPNIDEVKKEFPITGREIFAYGDTIYNPCGEKLPIWLVEHEECHQAQQAGDPEDWWKTYLRDRDFRFNQELEAHRVEFACFCRNRKDRNEQSKYLFYIARRLSSKMYGKLVSQREAISLIRKGK